MQNMTQLPLFPEWSDTDVNPQVTVRDYAERWLAIYGKPPWVTGYTGRVRRHIYRGYVDRPLGDRPLGAVTTREMAELQQALFARGLRMTTVRNVFWGVISPMWRQAVRDGLVTDIPSSRVRWPKYRPPRPDPYTRPEMARIVQHFDQRQPHWLPLVGLVCLAGLRPSEACGLRWEDVDLERGEIAIERSLVDREVHDPKTERSRRRIVLPARVLAMLAATPRAERVGYVVRHQDGRAVKSQRWGTRYFRPVLLRLGIRPRGFYGGRKTFMSDQVTRRAPLQKVAEYCGTSVAKLEAHYVRWLDRLDVPARRHA